jgi:L-ascorbate metabolism protein UlaG (beta-lactamase superfamily)
MKLTYFGHSCFAVETGGKKILFDPFITPNPLAKDIDVNRIEADYIFISHGHIDHVTDLISIAKRTNALCVAPAEISYWLERENMQKVHGMNHGGAIKFDFGTARGVNAIHSSSLPDGSYAGNPMGFVFTTNDKNFYYSGDTALTLDMQLIPNWAKLDFAVMPIGSNFTMDVADAIRAADFAQCNKVVGVHYNTFPPIKIDTAQAVKDFQASNKTLLLPKIGDTIEL